MADLSGTNSQPLEMPKASDWRCRLIGGPQPVVFVPTAGNEPNAFHRFMQRLCFGFVWEKKP